MTRQHFGTDGIRGRVGDPPITPEFVLKLGWAAGRVLAAEVARAGMQFIAAVTGKKVNGATSVARDGDVWRVEVEDPPAERCVRQVWP